ncbi:MAG: HAMP domain-containing sensor histidine kinase [Bacilli bacterium]|nr:HAMP domain-containing sensor histidine kinase [Bacilli bacterium]
MNTIQVNFAFDFCCLIFLTFLICIYMSKKNANNMDNRIYRMLLVSCFLTLLFNTVYPILFFLHVKPVSYFCARVYAISLILYFYFLAVYIVLVAKQKDLNFMKKIGDNNRLFFTIVLLIGSLFVLPCTFLTLVIKETEYNLLLDGQLIIYILLTQLFYSFIAIVVILIYRRNMDKSKVVPFYVLFAFAAVALTVASFFPSLVSVVIIITVITYLMYHTIENPDMQMVNELTLAKQQAEKASQVKSEFLASMSHELRTPLNAIVGLADVSIDSNNIEEVHNDIQDIKNSSLKLLELVDGILLSNNIDNNTVEITNSTYNIKELFDNVIHHTKMLLGEKNVQFKTMISDDLPTFVYGDREKVKVILNNLLSNAVKYTDEGFIELTVSSLINKDRCNLRITVSDTGKGIKEEDNDKLYEKFYRSEENIDSDIEGTGLGLAITKSLVELMDGKINVNSVFGEGTTFTINLTQQMVDNNSNDAEIL